MSAYTPISVSRRRIFAEESAPERNLLSRSAEELASERMAFMTTALGRFVVMNTRREKSFVPSKPILQWTNPISGSSDGIISVFRDQGRPAAIAQFFKPRTQAGHSATEFAVTTEEPIEFQRPGKLFWKSTEFIFDFKDILDAPEPADSPARCVPQMRKLAARFSVTDHHGRNDQIVATPLRLLTTPLRRYEVPGTIIDGALFSFAMGTDPECNLFWGAQQTETGPRYRYAFAPMSIYQLDARLDDKQIRTIEQRILFGDN